jgi:hypothetical protein
MKKIRRLLLGAFILLALAAGAQAAMVFQLDYNQDGIFDQTMQLKPGDEVAVDIYVSNVPEPGLGAMGFRLVIDPEKLEVVPDSSQVDATNWPAGEFVQLVQPGELHMAGFRLPPGLDGDDILLATVQLRCLKPGGSTLMLFDRTDATDDFVLVDDPDFPTVLDGDIAGGVLLAGIVPPSITSILMILLLD